MNLIKVNIEGEEEEKEEVEEEEIKAKTNFEMGNETRDILEKKMVTKLLKSFIFNRGIIMENFIVPSICVVEPLKSVAILRLILDLMYILKLI